ncbi:HGxxPAAW family protein [Streptomyces cinereoruber]|uniref:HGxxPAAW family protein n=1 Tax=Streptomyces cinereoruber TaxID=67260 RepID=UPI0036401782
MSAHGVVDLGHTPAGWTGTAFAAAGATAAGAGICLDRAWLLWLGATLVVLAAAATWVLHLAGWGKPSGPRPADQWDWRVRDTTAREGHPDCLGCRLAGRRPRTEPGEAGGRPTTEHAYRAPEPSGRLSSYSTSSAEPLPGTATRSPVGANPNRR